MPTFPCVPGPAISALHVLRHLSSGRGLSAAHASSAEGPRCAHISKPDKLVRVHSNNQLPSRVGWCSVEVCWACGTKNYPSPASFVWPPCPRRCCAAPIWRWAKYRLSWRPAKAQAHWRRGRSCCSGGGPAVQGVHIGRDRQRGEKVDVYVGARVAWLAGVGVVPGNAQPLRGDAGIRGVAKKCIRQFDIHSQPSFAGAVAANSTVARRSSATMDESAIPQLCGYLQQTLDPNPEVRRFVTLNHRPRSPLHPPPPGRRPQRHCGSRWSCRLFWPWRLCRRRLGPGLAWLLGFVLLAQIDSCSLSSIHGSHPSTAVLRSSPRGLQF